MQPSAHPYTELTPDRVLDAVDAAGWRTDGRLFGLNSYENRVYQIGLDDGASVVAKFYRPGRWRDAQIAEEHAFALELAAREIPVVAPLAREGRTLFEHAGFRFAVYPRRGGRTPELGDFAVLEWIGRFLGRIHAVGATQPFRERPALDPQSFGREPRDFILAQRLVPEELREAWSRIAALALEAVERRWQEAAGLARIRLHGDCHPGNILWTPIDDRASAMGGPHFVDLDDCRSGPAIQDLWMLLSGDRTAMQQQLAAVLRGYEPFCDFDARGLLLIEPLRTLRLLHYAAWIGARWDDPAFPAAFPWFGTARYWQDRVLELREQVAAMDEPPLERP
ncbi:MAG: serine/threonine protein kinase [Burkholderiales bacterium]|nr:serine/threonine protein kinase [Burkholderiales bacterium]